MGLLHDLEDGKKREISEEDFDYFLDALPPVAMRFRWNNEPWHFGFAEGYDYVYAFKKEAGKYYAQKTDLLNPWECGVSFNAPPRAIPDPFHRTSKEATMPEPTSPVADQLAADNTQAASAAAATPASHARVQAPEKQGDAYTIDNRIGYRTEDSPDGRRRQICFADREGGQKPDEELLAPVRDEKPDVSWQSKQRAWQARKTPEGLQAIGRADDELAEIGRKRTGGHER